jgi:hypothetical protein
VRWHSIAAQAADVGDGRGHGGGLLIGSPLDHLNHVPFTKRGRIEPKLRDISLRLFCVVIRTLLPEFLLFQNPAPTRHNCDTRGYSRQRKPWRALILSFGNHNHGLSTHDVTLLRKMLTQFVRHPKVLNCRRLPDCLFV